MLWYGMIWCGVVWCGVVRYDMIFYGVCNLAAALCRPISIPTNGNLDVFGVNKNNTHANDLYCHHHRTLSILLTLINWSLSHSLTSFLSLFLCFCFYFYRAMGRWQSHQPGSDYAHHLLHRRHRHAENAKRR